MSKEHVAKYLVARKAFDAIRDEEEEMLARLNGEIMDLNRKMNTYVARYNDARQAVEDAAHGIYGELPSDNDYESELLNDEHDIRLRVLNEALDNHTFEEYSFDEIEELESGLEDDPPGDLPLDIIERVFEILGDDPVTPKPETVSVIQVPGTVAISTTTLTELASALQAAVNILSGIPK